LPENFMLVGKQRPWDHDAYLYSSSTMDETGISPERLRFSKFKACQRTTPPVQPGGRSFPSVP
jgi:hypothetical protein